MPHPRRSSAVLVAVLLAACQGAESAPEEVPASVASALQPGASAAAPAVVEIVGLDYAFEAPAEIDAGWTTFRFANHGPEPHHLSLVRLEGGHTVDDLVAAMRDPGNTERISTPVGGPNAAMPHGATSATVNLTPGEYALLCLVPSPDGVPHIFKGMVKPITVRESSATAAAPRADVELTFSDYSFQLSAPITAGERTIRATTTPGSTEVHEVVVARLAPGRTVEDLNAWIHDMQGPPPAEFIGGVTALAPGLSNTFTVDFTPGEYAFICPIPSSKDGQAHSMKGMLHQFTVM